MALEGGQRAGRTILDLLIGCLVLIFFVGRGVYISFGPEPFFGTSWRGDIISQIDFSASFAFNLGPVLVRLQVEQKVLPLFFHISVNYIMSGFR